MESDNGPKFSKTLQAVIDDAIALVRGHIELAKLELKQSAKSVVIAIAAFVLTLAFVNLAVILLFVAAGFGLNAAGLPLWASFLIISGGLFLFALLALAIGVTRLKKAKTPGKSAQALSSTLDRVRGLLIPPKN